MIIHSIAPPENLVIQPPLPEYSYISGQNSYFQGIKAEDGFTMTRLISTNPKDYLKYNPGDKINHPTISC